MHLGRVQYRDSPATVAKDHDTITQVDALLLLEGELT